MSLEEASVRGVQVHYGPRTTNETNGGVQNTGTRKKAITYKFSYDDLPVGGTDELRAFVPAGAAITDCYVKATDDFVGGTSYDIGLIQSDDSTAIDLDGIFDALTLAQANAGADMREHAGTNSGALIAQELAADGYLKVVATGTFTAGEATLVLEYLM